MSSPERFTRRTLLSLLGGPAPKPRPAPPPPPAAKKTARAGGFSLEAFYRARAAEPGVSAPPPVITQRQGLEFIPATRVGVPELAAATAPPPTPAATDSKPSELP